MMFELNILLDFYAFFDIIQYFLMSENFQQHKIPSMFFRYTINFLFVFHVKHSGTREQASILEFLFQEIILSSRLTTIESYMKALNFHFLILVYIFNEL